jgi:hypothetical protein
VCPDGRGFEVQYCSVLWFPRQRNLIAMILSDHISNLDLSETHIIFILICALALILVVMLLDIHRCHDILTSVDYRCSCQVRLTIAYPHRTRVGSMGYELCSAHSASLTGSLRQLINGERYF